MEGTMELRQMPEIQVIAAYLRSMTFKKKTFGGCDTESVLDHFAAVSQQYEAILSAFLAQNQQNAFQIVTLQNMLAQKQQEDAVQAWQQQELVQWYEGTIAALQAGQQGGGPDPYTGWQNACQPQYR